MERLKRIVRWVGYSMLVAAILAVATWTAVNVVARKRLRRSLESLKAQGHPIRLSDLAQGSVAPEHNAGPLYEAGVAMIAERNPDEDAAYYRVDSNGFASVSEGDRELLRGWVGRNADALRLLRLGRSRPACRFERDRDPVSYPFPRIGLLRLTAATNCLSVAAQAEAARGKEEEARELVRDILAIAGGLQEEPFLIVQMTRIALIGTGLNAVDRCITAETTAAELSKWRDLLPDDRNLDRVLVRTLQGELAYGIEILTNTEAWMQANLWDSPGLGSRIRAHALLPLERLDAPHYFELMRRTIEACRLPYRDRRTRAREILAELESASRPRWQHLLCAVLTPSMTGAFDAFAKCAARVVVVRAGLEFERIHAETGAYPQSTTEADPFTGTALGIGPDGAIFSIGGDGKAGTSDDVRWKPRRRK